MATSRRKFMKAGALGALLAGIPLKTAAKEILEPHSSNTGSGILKNDHAALNLRSFTEQLNTKFRIHHGNKKTTDIKLIQVKDLRVQSTGICSRECFAAVFIGAPRSGLRQETYEIEHQTLGKFSMLLVPTSALSDKGQYYEAIFNRL